ncbi:MAG TPA: 50S ribosomal protein L6 [Aggregatilinea sp.]|uniref:50S ribosomal protein L6 n=1 Tax=Aggregatilinea sp. TaxID=2806333 RepID=UPI002BEC63EB|nr:50S ribosomal protein L6 [Aggregatilinea sp.]HML22138.1 50S ribosomal protein L6 [Aggregatilinea sp.]
MSRIGKKPVPIPAKVQVNIDGTEVTVKGPKGQLFHKFPADVTIAQEEGVVVVTRPSDLPKHRALHGMTRALIANMVSGVSEGFERVLEIEGVGYRAEMDGKTLVLYLGYSHPIRVEPPADVEFAAEERGRLIRIRGIDKQVVGELAAEIRKMRPPEPYKGKGVRYQGERIRRKAGKTGKA